MAVTKSSSQSTLKQTALQFNASKRTASTNTQANKKTASAVSTTDVEISSSESDSDEVEIVEAETSVSFPGKRKKSSSPVTEKPAKNPAKNVKLPKIEENVVVVEPLDISPSQKRWKEHAQKVREKRGKLPLQLIHAEDQNVFDDILRVFDLSCEFGPCVGISRLDRWERAKTLGLSPPPEARGLASVSRLSDRK
ncbi:hypothetical protein HMN09_01166500 [Mycena chlorophos]|uniref:DNA polymerase delta subunit 4 n=1 Tax=Mycena chlorophos TaxID=658473 RepID=A0A8H6S9Q5_MYCCL|nr:hypothetical protein HMN09_01166500 [Mycena chlorophos]